MKYEVIRRFRDKYTGEIILPGSTFICDETDRIKDLTDRGIIKKQDLNPDEMTKKELLALANNLGIEGLNDRMLKADIIERIKEGM